MCCAAVGRCQFFYRIWGAAARETVARWHACQPTQSAVFQFINKMRNHGRLWPLPICNELHFIFFGPVTIHCGSHSVWWEICVDLHRKTRRFGNAENWLNVNSKTSRSHLLTPFFVSRELWLAINLSVFLYLKLKWFHSLMRDARWFCPNLLIKLLTKLTTKLVE